MQFLRDLKLERHQGNWCRHWKPELLEHRSDTFRDGKSFRFIRVTDFIVPHFNENRVPRSTTISQFDVQGLHHILERQSPGRGLRPDDQVRSEVIPSRCQSQAKVP